MFRRVIENIWGGASRHFSQYLLYSFQYLWNTKIEDGNNCALSFVCFLRSRSAHTPCPSRTFYAHEFFAFIFSNGARPFSVKRKKTMPWNHNVSSVPPSAFFFLGVLPLQGCVYKDVGCFQDKKTTKQHKTKTLGFQFR